MHKLAAPTFTQRATLTREIRTILEPSEFSRRVTLVLPPGEPAYIGIDTVVLTPESSSLPAGREEYKPLGLNPNEGYLIPQMPPDVALFFHLAPGQHLVGASRSGLVYAGLIVEHYPA
jgi:hypothetical protein